MMKWMKRTSRSNEGQQDRASFCRPFMMRDRGVSLIDRAPSRIALSCETRKWGVRAEVFSFVGGDRSRGCCLLREQVDAR